MKVQKSGISRSRLAGAYISAVVSIALVLVLVGIAALLMLNSRKVTDYFKESLQMTVYLKQEVADSTGAAFLAKLKTEPYTREANLVNREQGEKELREMLGDDFLSVFGTVPVPISIELNLKAEYTLADSLTAVQTSLEKCPEVDEVNARKGLAEAISTNMKRLSLLVAALMAVLGFISIILITNVTRLLLFSKRYAVNTMQLVGASRRFIMKPFLGQAAIQGAAAAVLALGILYGVLSFVKSNVPNLFEILTKDDMLVTAAVVLCAGLVLCVVSAFFVVLRLLSMNKNELYG